MGVKLFRITLTNEGILMRRRAEEKISIGCGKIAAVQALPNLIKTLNAF